MKTSSKVWSCIAGVALVALGIVCLMNPGDTIFSLAWAIGLLMLVAGVSNCVNWFIIGRHLPQRSMIMFSAIVETLLGFVLLINPAGMAVALPFLFAAFVMFEGLSLTLESFDFKKVGFKYWYCLLILGLVGVVLGVYGLFYNPTASAKVLSTIVSLGIIFDGLGYIMKVIGVTYFERRLKKVKDQIKFVEAEEVK